MSRITIRRPHALGPAEVRARVSRAATKLTERFGANCSWDGDVLSIEHSSVTGTVRLEPNEVVVDARLGVALSIFRSRAEDEIARILDRELSR